MTKQVVGNPGAGQPDKFTFNITAKYANGTPVNKTISGVEFKNGVGKFTLTADETKTFSIEQEDVTGVEWTVEETTGLDNQWSTTIAGSDGIEIGETNKSASGTLTPSDSQSVTFTNTYTTPTGTLVVRKDANDSTSLFSFTLTVEGLDSGEVITSGGKQITLDGKNSYTFTLGNAQTRSFTIPENVKWTVTETDPGEHWATVVSGDGTLNQDARTASGTVQQGTEQTVKFENTYTAPGSLVVSKTVEGSDDDTEYKFNVTIGGVEEPELTLKNGETHTYDNLANGTSWTVTETSNLEDGWTTTVNGQADKTVSGTIESGVASSASFVNSAPGKLVVSKKVEGEDAPEDEEFGFTIAYGEHSEPFVLEDGGEKVFNLPAGTKYTVTENEPGENWTASVNGEAGNTFDGTIIAGATTNAEFTNTYTEPQEPPEQPEKPEQPEEPEQPEPTPPVVVNPPRPGNGDDGNNGGDLADTVPPMLNGDDHFAYIIGYEDGTVRPGGQITRAEVATVIFRLLRADVRDGNLTTDNSFTDVNDGDWYNTAVSTLVKLGIVEGRTSTTFEPNAPITRAEFATLFARFDESGVKPEASFTDVSAHWAREYIERAAALGWINGYEDGTFRPDSLITRAEAMTMINRVLNREPETENDLLPDMRVWSDNQPGVWYYLAVQEATNSHEYARPNAPYEHWTEITADPNWERYQ